MAHFSFPYYFTIPNSEFRIPKLALRISKLQIRNREVNKGNEPVIQQLIHHLYTCIKFKNSSLHSYWENWHNSTLKKKIEKKERQMDK